MVSESPPDRRSDGGHWLRRAVGLTWLLVMVVLVVLAIIVSIGRQYANQIDGYRAELEQLLSEQLGQPVKVGRLEAHWQGIDPILDVYQIVLEHPDSGRKAAVELEHLRLRLATITSLLRWRLVFEEFQGDGLDFTVRQYEDGQVTIDGLQLLADGDSAPTLPGPDSAYDEALGGLVDYLGSILSNPYVQVTRVTVGLDVPGEPRQYLDIPQANLHYHNGVFTASGRAMRSGTTEQLASFSLWGRHFFRGAFTGQLYLDVDSGRLLDGLVQRYRWGGLNITGFDLEGQAWFTFANGNLIQASGLVALPYLNVAVADEPLPPIEHIRAHVAWRPSTDAQRHEWQLQGLTWRWGGEVLPPVNGVLRWHPEPSLYLERLGIGPLARLALALDILPARATDALQGYQPEGELRHLSLMFADQGFKLLADLEGMSVKAHRGAPQAYNLNGLLQVERHQGRVTVQSAEAELSFPELFADAWQLENLMVDVGWELLPGAIKVASRHISMQHEGQMALSGQFELFLQADDEDVLSLQVRNRGGSADMLGRFIPKHRVSPAFYDWITSAVLTAEVEEGWYFGHGAISPGAGPNAFTSVMRYRFRNGAIRYDPQWPEATNVHGEVIVRGAEAEVRVAEGQTGGLSLRPTLVTVKPEDGWLDLQVNTAAQVPGEAINPWLTDTPIRQVIGPVGELMTATGTFDIGLKLGIPIGKSEPPTLDLRVASRNATATFLPAELSWQSISGEVRYRSAEGFSGDGLRGQFLQGPVQVNLAMTEDNTLRVIQRGDIALPQLLERFRPTSPELAGVSGATRYRAQLDFPQGGQVVLNLSTDLRGITSAWPAPLGKAAEESAPLSLRLDWLPVVGEPLHTAVTGRWDDRLALRLDWQDTRFERGGIAVGERSARLPDDPGLMITGRLPGVAVEQWLNTIQDLLNDGAAAPAERGAVVQPAPAGLLGLDLQVGQLELSRRTFSDVRVRATPRADGWRLNMDSDSLAGQVQIPARRQEPVLVELERLVLPERAAAVEPGADIVADAASTRPFREIPFETWRDAEVHIRQLTLGQTVMGEWVFRLVPGPGSLLIGDIRGEIGSLVFSGDLGWALLDDMEQTRITGRLEGGSLADLSPWIRGAIPLRNERTRANIDLAWPGSPDTVSVVGMSGHLDVLLRDGALMERSNPAPLFRIFGILNSDNLLRRLRLDFSDLYQAGVAFDAISGSARLDQGTLNWDPELQIVGPSGAFRLTGSTQMADETLDMRLVVAIPVTQNLPLAAILLGASPPVGGALFVLDKLLGDPLSRLTSATYTVGGTWDNPQVQLRGMFDGGR
ncbi:MAG: TIGR02099 family protein [Marinobacter sp.]|nr:TIGR02099 family protein [Marinobacter sp.]